MNPYTLDRVSTFLLYDALSWCIKNRKDQANFFRRNPEGVRDDIFATPREIKEELARRESEVLDNSIICVNCGNPADGRCYFHERDQLCPACYWTILKNIAAGNIPMKSVQGTVIDISKAKKKLEKVQLEETREEIASRIGLPVETLEETGFFD